MNDKEQIKQTVRQEINRYGRKTLYASAFLSIPFIYVTYMIIRDKFSENIVLVLGLGLYLLISIVISRLIKSWLYKKPPNSGWYNWLD